MFGLIEVLAIAAIALGVQYANQNGLVPVL